MIKLTAWLLKNFGVAMFFAFLALKIPTMNGFFWFMAVFMTCFLWYMRWKGQKEAEQLRDEYEDPMPPTGEEQPKPRRHLTQHEAERTARALELSPKLLFTSFDAIIKGYPALRSRWSDVRQKASQLSKEKSSNNPLFWELVSQAVESEDCFESKAMYVLTLLERA